MLKTIIFDFDGTIANTLEATVEVYNKLASRFRCKPINSNDLERLRNGRPKELMAEFGVTVWKLPFLIFAVRKGLGDHKILPQDGMIDVVRTLKNQGILLGILTSNSKQNVERFLKEHDLQNHFAFIASYHRIFGKHKALIKIVKSRGLNPSEVAYVGDEVRDVESAKRARVKSVGVTWGFQTQSAIENTEPDVIATIPSELLELTKQALDS